MNCETAKLQLVLSAYGELSFDQEEILEQHLDTCAGCAAERIKLEKLGALLDQGEAGIPAGLLARCRRELAVSLQHERTRQSPFVTLRNFWRNWIVNPPMWLRPLGAVAMLAVGFFGASFVPAHSTTLAQMGVTQDPPPVISKVRLVNPD